MKPNLLILLLFFTSVLQTMAQSPLNYGQNKKVYFISREEQRKLGIEKIYCVDQRKGDDRGGMGENWDVISISLDTNQVSVDWAPLNLDEKYQYNFDALTSNMKILNGIQYYVMDGHYTGCDGNGYGSFDQDDINPLSDTVLLLTRHCSGHCGNKLLKYSKSIFNKKGQMLYTINYPVPDSLSMELDTVPVEKAFNNFVRYISKTNGYKTDTVIYKDDGHGLQLSLNKDISIGNVSEVKKLFTMDGDLAIFKFHQCYMGNTLMEKFVKDKLGYTPELLLLEIYARGVLSFVLNKSDKKYYQAAEILMDR